MKLTERQKAIELRKGGYSIKAIADEVSVAKSSVSVWVRDVPVTESRRHKLNANPHSLAAIEKRRQTRLANELRKRTAVISSAREQVPSITKRELWLMGVMLYWAEGGKTQRIVRFSNGDPEMIKLMMRFFREVCDTPESKFRGYIHIHPHLDTDSAEKFWSDTTGIPLNQFFKTYNKRNKSSQGKKDSLPYGVMDIYVLDARLFLQITGWAQGIFDQSS